MRLAVVFVCASEADLACVDAGLATVTARGWPGSIHVLGPQEILAQAHKFEAVSAWGQLSEVGDIAAVREGRGALASDAVPELDRHLPFDKVDRVAALTPGHLVTGPIGRVMSFGRVAGERCVLAAEPVTGLGAWRWLNARRGGAGRERPFARLGTPAPDPAFLVLPGGDPGERLCQRWRARQALEDECPKATLVRLARRDMPSAFVRAPRTLHARAPLTADTPPDAAFTFYAGATDGLGRFQNLAAHVASAGADGKTTGTSQTDRGVVYICTGAAYIRAALRSAASLRRTNPEFPIHLFADVSRAGMTGAVTEAKLDGVTDIGSGDARAKVDWLPETPFRRTLYLDTDTEVITDISDVFDLLDRFDIALAHAHARNRELTHETWTKPLPDSFPQYNGGVIAYRWTAPVRTLLEAWRDGYRRAGFRKDQVVLRELLWDSDVRLATLPPEYNIRYEKYLNVWSKKEATPRILHLARLHSDERVTSEEAAPSQDVSEEKSQC